MMSKASLNPGLDGALRNGTDFSDVEYLPLLRSTVDDGRELLAQRFDELGYLYLPELIPLAETQPLLDDFLRILAPTIVWSDAHKAPVLKGEPFFETDPHWDRVYPQLQALERFHRFFHQGEILRIMQLLRGDDAFVYPMKMARIAAPKKLGFETPPHQDAHSHHAGPTMAGIWVALHDADEAMGRLTLLPGSHRRGVRPVFQAQGVGGVQCEIYPEENTWHVSDVSAGDVIIFHSQTVHRAQPNTDSSRVRLSVDTRFCDFGAPVFSTNLEPHHGWRIGGLDWDAIYCNWEAGDLKYYWSDYPGLF